MKDKIPGSEEKRLNIEIDSKEEKRLKLIENVLNIPQEQTELLRQLIKSTNTQSIIRRAAIHRLTNLVDLKSKKPDTTVADLFKTIFNDFQDDKCTRVRAYEAYRYLRSVINPMDEREIDEDRRYISQDPSERMRWLRSLGD